ncbi:MULTISPECIES: SMI1/KNR4 family protein [Bacillus]|uniref:SMI1/KNR4 family protein n=1 Tax=Bacillus pseudomycoides TaxID=64104 RepID=A0AAJ2DN69_9BACI|nr:SMI1/KNR4 family protein [Bacillus pseudomycoides]MCR8859843.1 SMI1/KNR4 family protein [Bacillus pseudomycoides]MDR4328376.1 SMI1/KNR4 family protein [Bacillus pseudomycoides]MED1536868.1 SMI1/KNR4 family protein [Bacillus pseudomycoides]PFY86159.1 SMI1/KNR4 family protein [Bacillus pseudomycoides]PFZ88427.1 SMI1/KNR4 family protein [Bacillus pseudomycoides]
MKKRYEALYSNEGINDEDLVKIEEKLNIKLPEDFCEIATFFSGGYFGGISNHSFSNVDNSLNIIDETIRLREVVHLPSRFIVLAEPPESLIVMDTLNTPAIIWFDGVEISELEKKSFTSKPDEWETYADYFEELLEEEEEEQGI